MASSGDINYNDVEPHLFDGWLKLPLDQVIQRNGTYSKLNSIRILPEGKYPVIDQGDKFISGFINEDSLKYNGSLPVVIFGDHTRNIKYVDFEFAVGADGTKILNPITELNSLFFYYYLKSLKIPSLGYSRHYKVLKDISVPVPPLPEQNRIVEKLDKLFASLEIVKTKLDAVPPLLKNFRQAVLSQGVTGRLTGITVASSQLSVLLEDVKYGTSKKSEYAIGGIPILRIPNIKDGEIDTSDIKFSVLEDREFLQLKLKVGDILIIRSNGSSALVGQCAVIRAEHAHYAYAGYLIRLRVNQNLNPEFLNYVLQSSNLRAQIEDMSRSTNGINNINSNEIKNLIVPFTGLEEQKAIVTKIKTLFSEADLIEKHYKTLKLKVDHLPQAILSKAFSGNLVSQNPDDEPASELLLRIKEVQALSKKVTRLTQVVL